MRDVVNNPIPYDLGYCPCCGFRLQSNWTYCPHCGGLIDQDGLAAACHCGKKFADDEQRYCSKCGQKRAPRVIARTGARS